jgi:hypothetical protein
MRRFVIAVLGACCLVILLVIWAGSAKPVSPRVAGQGASPAVSDLVRGLSFENYKSNIKTLAAFGSRDWDTVGNEKARQWVRHELETLGYRVESHRFKVGEKLSETLYATKAGRSQPDKMYIVSCHIDSVGPGADDDASGCSLVLEAARSFSSSRVEPEYSIRFVFWNAEEPGLLGSKAYVQDRHEMQGKSSEPAWLGVIQSDMLLLDRGLPVFLGFFSLTPNPPDVDVEYRGDRSRALAESFIRANQRYSADYGAEIGSEMSNTDSMSFLRYCPTISLRENRRISEIGEGANPHWHKRSDTFDRYREKDFLLGFNALQMTVGALGELTEIKSIPH